MSSARILASTANRSAGGVGVVDLDTKEEDFISHLVFATTHNDLLFFSDKGKAYQVRCTIFPKVGAPPRASP